MAMIPSMGRDGEDERTPSCPWQNDRRAGMNDGYKLKKREEKRETGSEIISTLRAGECCALAEKNGRAEETRYERRMTDVMHQHSTQLILAGSHPQERGRIDLETIEIKSRFRFSFPCTASIWVAKNLKLKVTTNTTIAR